MSSLISFCGFKKDLNSFIIFQFTSISASPIWMASSFFGSKPVVSKSSAIYLKFLFNIKNYFLVN